jgi:hypothetical protein
MGGDCSYMLVTIHIYRKYGSDSLYLRRNINVEKCDGIIGNTYPYAESRVSRARPCGETSSPPAQLVVEMIQGHHHRPMSWLGLDCLQRDNKTALHWSRLDCHQAGCQPQPERLEKGSHQHQRSHRVNRWTGS